MKNPRVKTPTVLTLLLAATLFTFAGCRRADVREVTLSVPGLTVETQPKVVAALTRYGGVEKDSLRFDFAGKTVTLRYDSMQVAQTNLRMAIEAKGVAVEYPPNRNGQ